VEIPAVALVSSRATCVASGRVLPAWARAAVALVVARCQHAARMWHC
jgi:hypothetical protein